MKGRNWIVPAVIAAALWVGCGQKPPERPKQSKQPENTAFSVQPETTAFDVLEGVYEAGKEIQDAITVGCQLKKLTGLVATFTTRISLVRNLMQASSNPSLKRLVGQHIDRYERLQHNYEATIELFHFQANYQNCIENLRKDWCRKNYQARAATFKEDFSTDNIKVNPFDKNATADVLGQINTLHNQANAELLGQKRK